MTRIDKRALGCVAVFALMAAGAQAQIITQNPRPQIPETDAFGVETVKPQRQTALPGDRVKIPRSGAMLFAGFDSNTDYMIDMAEVTIGIERAFRAADRDDNGNLSLVELEGWRFAALGSRNADPGNFAFAPNFARTVSKAKFTEVLMRLADTFDRDAQGESDGRISIPDLMRSYAPPRASGPLPGRAQDRPYRRGPAPETTRLGGGMTY